VQTVPEEEGWWGGRWAERKKNVLNGQNKPFRMSDAFLTVRYYEANSEFINHIQYHELSLAIRYLGIRSQVMFFKADIKLS
jgi:hypothetical protein